MCDFSSVIATQGGIFAVIGNYFSYIAHVKDDDNDAIAFHFTRQL